MDEDARTIWCGNLSTKCTEDILYELFLQAGPLEKVNIPKDRDGTIKSFGFVTYKHEVSVPYALDLFDGTSLYNRILTLKARQSADTNKNPSPIWQTPLNNINNFDPNSVLLYGQQLMLNSQMLNLNQNLLPIFIPPGLGLYPSQINNSSFTPPMHYQQQHQQDRRAPRNHPYNNRDRDRERERERDRNNHSHRNDHRNHHKNNSSNSNKDHHGNHSKEHKNNHKNQRHYHNRSGRNNR